MVTQFSTAGFKYPDRLYGKHAQDVHRSLEQEKPRYAVQLPQKSFQYITFGANLGPRRPLIAKTKYRDPHSSIRSLPTQATRYQPKQLPRAQSQLQSVATVLPQTLNPSKADFKACKLQTISQSSYNLNQMDIVRSQTTFKLSHNDIDIVKRSHTVIRANYQPVQLRSSYYVNR